MFIRKLRFGLDEVNNLVGTLEGYVWAAIDIKKGIIAVGDEPATQLRLGLFGLGCKLEDIYGVGIDLWSGEIHYRSPINRKTHQPESNLDVPDDVRDRIETLVHYFFSNLPAYNQRRPRYTKLPDPVLFRPIR